MISFKTFDYYIETLRRFSGLINKLMDLGVNLIDCEPIMNMEADFVNLLEDAMGDSETNWISYWIYELDFGANYTDGAVITPPTNEHIPLKTSEDLYNLLIGNMNDIRS